MAINPSITTTVKVGELPSAPFSATDFIPHEVGGNLKKGTIADFTTYISNILGSSDAIGFRAVTVADGQQLPSVTTDKNEFILVGKGTYPNVNGGQTIICTKELNALITDGTTWSLGVEIAIEAPDSSGGSGGLTELYFENIASSPSNTHTLPSGVKAISIHVDGGFRRQGSQWAQSGATLTFLGTTTIGKKIDITGIK